MKLNERAWAVDLIKWVHEIIDNGATVFQDAKSEAGIKLDSGKTKFPDVLLFIDKISGIVFNGWELKFPDTPADDREMLLNALEKAQKLKANSFVTWNGSQAIIWKIKDKDYSLDGISPLKIYPKEEGINSRDDLADHPKYQKFEPKLKSRLNEIIHDLEKLYINGEIQQAVDISTNIVEAIRDTGNYLIPQLRNAINDLKGANEGFRKKFNEWKILESATLKILSSSSRRVETVEPENVLAKFTYYKLIGKILFYLTLSENLSAKIPKLKLTSSKNIKRQLNDFFNQAKEIDYQAVFENDFTDQLKFNTTIENLVYKLIDVFNEFDFKILPTEVIGNILENLVPKEEKQKFGQYFTSEKLANLVAFSAIKDRNVTLFDPTSGTGTFLTSFYNILSHFGLRSHQQLLNQIWGNDISHFSAVLSVINLYKQKINDVANFPRITRRDYFGLFPGQKIKFPDPVDIHKLQEVELPKFDAIISNFPFIQQEDIPNKILSDKFKGEFQHTQVTFLKGKSFEINERSDYYVYCFYNSLKFLKDGGYIAAIASNAWLGKNYGLQFKKFLLDNFSIQYVFRSNAEHWFTDSKVSTIFITLKKTTENLPAKFVTLNFKLDEFFNEDTAEKNLKKVEELYAEIDHCDNPNNTNWKRDEHFPTAYIKIDGSVRVSIAEKEHLLKSIQTQENWATNFIAQNPLSIFDKFLINPFPSLIDTGRGTRTGWDNMHILSADEAKQFKIEKDFLLPVLKSSQDLTSIVNDSKPEDYLFVCTEPISKLKSKYKNVYKWITKWEKEKNKTGVTLTKVFEKRKPYWYSLTPEEPANIYISINPDKKLFFSYNKKSIYLNQRLVAIRAKQKDVELIAALLNSIVSLLIVELNGVSRNLGALDLNADFFQTKMKILNPALLKEKDKELILKMFKPVSKRPVKNFKEEFRLQDRIDFDKAVLKGFDYDTGILKRLYEILEETATNRIEMKDR